MLPPATSIDSLPIRTVGLRADLPGQHLADGAVAGCPLEREELGSNQ